MSNSNTQDVHGPRGGKSNQAGLKKFATLSPYLVEIEKRRKARSVLKETRSKSKHETSSKSFRIKDRSSSSLKSQSKKQLNNKTIAHILSKIQDRKKEESSRSKNMSVQKDKMQVPSSTCTIKQSNRQGSGLDETEKRDRKDKKNMSFRRNKFENRSRNEIAISSDDPNKKTIQVSKYGYTETNRTTKIQEPVAVKQENMYAPPKKNFRRGKYEALYSSVNSNEVAVEVPGQPNKSESQLEITKKESNVSINKELDLLGEKEITTFYRTIKSKQIRNSLEKSTQNYFMQGSGYRAPKSNTDIQIYVSTVKNPSLNRQSNASTLYSSEKVQNSGEVQLPITKTPRQRESQLLVYDFDFKETDVRHNIQGIAQIENPSEEESINLNLKEDTSFERQRKQVERQFFHKKSPQVDWSDEDCQIDEL